MAEPKTAPAPQQTVSKAAWWSPRSWAPDVRWGLGVVTAVAGLGGLATEIGPWYFALRQPAWKPPDWAFGPVWSIIYLTTLCAGVRTWRRLPMTPRRSGFLLACGINAMLNVVWSVLYFSWRRPDWALVEGAVLWGSAVWVACLMWRVDRVAVVLMLPHLAWLTLAWVLNFETVRLNSPFGS